MTFFGGGHAPPPGTQNWLGGFGGQPPPPQGMSFFGGSAPQQATSWFGGPSQQHAPGSSWFGQAGQAQAPPQGGSWFGGQQAAQAQNSWLGGQPKPDAQQKWGWLGQGQEQNQSRTLQGFDGGLVGKLQNALFRSPLETQRTCTDVVWIFVFLAALGGFAYCIHIGILDGDVRRLTRLVDYEGNLCGESGQGQFLYLCKGSPGAALDLHHPICVQTCPAGPNTQMTCRGSLQVSQAGYASHPVANVFCMPDQGVFLKQAEQLFDQNQLFSTLRFITRFYNEPEPVIIALAIASLLSSGYLFLISWCAKILVWIGLSIMAVIPGSFGGYMIYESSNIEATLSTGNQEHDWIIGIICCVLSLFFICVVIGSAKSIQKAIEAIEEAASCILQMPVLVMQPWLAALVQLVVVVPGILGFLLLNLAGKEVPSVDPEQDGQIYKPSDMDVVSLIYYTIVFLWIMELLNAISQFIIVYVAEVWYFKKRGSSASALAGFTVYDMFQAFTSAIFYHLGSLICGSFLITLFRAARIAAAFLIRASEDAGNPILSIVAKCFQCCLTCAQKVVNNVTSMAYMDIALNSSTYCEGAEKAVKIVYSDAGTLAAVEGSTFLFSFIGIGAVTFGASSLTGLLVRSAERYSDISSPHFVEDVRSHVVVAAIVGAFVAFPFMYLFDVVADTMIFCRASSRGSLASASPASSRGWFG
eukprot:TRINITY_DN30575_c0_g1_i1.p1 TRINITY_DN30575_c0_g1~~TRINITY_DN30575_c0_g1_i1.p1  ORF type:complete len:698 (+),score=112.36 TRINITY_DN30575_c0_g1_i1:105-2198(+)